MTGHELVGRSAERAFLRDMVTALASGVGGVVLVEGEQGIGKSALLRAGLGSAGNAERVFWGAADELGQRFPLRLMADCLGAAADGPLSLPASGAAGGAGPVFDGTAFGGDPLLGAVEGMLAAVDRLCAAGPVLLVAEDLHWADEASLLVWHRLSRAVTQLPLLLAGSSRPAPGREDLSRLRRGLAARGRLIELGPLSEAEISELTGRRAGGRPGRRLTRLLEQAGGNPLYATELADGLVRGGRLQVAGDVAELVAQTSHVPGSLAAAITERLESLPEDALAVLRWAAVLGHEFSVTDLEVVTERTAGELMTVIDSATGAGVLTDAAARLGFRHGLIRQVLYEGIPGALRSALHLQAARALAGAGAAAERVAAQLVMVPGPAGSWVVDWLAGAADRLVYRAPEVAAELLRTAVTDLPDSDPRRDGLEASLAAVAFQLIDHEEVERIGRRRLARPGNDTSASEMSWLVGYSLMRSGQAGAAREVVDEGLARPGAGGVVVLRLRALRAMILTVLGELEAAEAAATGALADARRAGDRIGAGYALHALSSVSFASGRGQARLDYTVQGLAEVGDEPQAADLRLLLQSNQAFALSDLDRPQEAQTSIRQALIMAERMGTPRLGMTRTALASLYTDTGQWDDALAELESAVGLASPLYYRLPLHGAYAFIAGHRDERDTAREHLDAVAGQEFANVAFWSNAYALLLARAVAAEQEGRLAGAVAELAPCLDPEIGPQMPNRGLLLPTLLRLALAAGDEATAAAAVSAAAADAKRRPPVVSAAEAHQHCQGLLAGDRALLAGVAAYYERTGRPLLQGLALEDSAAIAAAAGDSAAARRALAAALGLYLRLGAQWDLQRAKERLAAHGVRPGRAGAVRSRPVTGWAALTSTERKVALLVGTGMSNPDIAARLFLSRNTVQTHVSHILAKLGAHSRAEIVRQAHEKEVAGEASA